MLAARHAYKFYLSLLLLAHLCRSIAVELCELGPQSFADSPYQQWPVLHQAHFSFVHGQLNVLFMQYAPCKVIRSCMQPVKPTAQQGSSVPVTCMRHVNRANTLVVWSESSRVSKPTLLMIPLTTASCFSISMVPFALFFCIKCIDTL